MATILDIQTVGDIYIISCDVNPSLGAGTPAPKGSIANANDGSGSFYKKSTSDTNWITLSSLQPNYISKTSNYTIQVDDGTIDCVGGSFTVTLLSASEAGEGKIYVIKNSLSGVIVLNTTSSQTIDSRLTQIIRRGNSIMVQSTGSNWIII